MARSTQENVVFDKIREIAEHWKALQKARRAHQDEKAVERFQNHFDPFGLDGINQERPMGRSGFKRPQSQRHPCSLCYYGAYSH